MPATLTGPVVFVAYDLTFLTHPEHHTQENIALCRASFERAARSSCVFAAISESTKADLVRHYGVDPRRVFVAYPGVDPDVFRPRSTDDGAAVRQKYELPERYFLFVGSLEPRKNLHTVVEAMLTADVEETLVVAGASGWMNSRLHEVIARAGSRVKMLGYVPQQDLPSLYSAASATVYASLYEGFGYPVVESMACGTPVVTSDNSSLSEIARDAALLLRQPEDPSEIRSALERMSSDAGLRERLAQAGRERAGRFVPAVGAKATVDMYRTLMA
jgi:alpha-1,3-rhamnosyl/mannosyltransferase